MTGSLYSVTRASLRRGVRQGPIGKPGVLDLMVELVS